MNENEKIELLGLPTKIGISMLKAQYENLVEFISATLECQANKRIALNDLLDKARKDLDKEFQGNVSWYLLQVKTDMEVRGLINIVVTKQRQQIIEKGPSKNPTTFRRRYKQNKQS